MAQMSAGPIVADPSLDGARIVAHFSARVARPQDGKPLLFLDFEASSLDRDSWPVEIGFAWLAGRRVEMRSEIIAPEADWSMRAWSEASARLHGLTIDTVRAGRPAAEVAALTDGFADFTVVSDNPRWEQLWLDRLRAHRAPLAVHDLRALAVDRLTETAADIFAMRLFRSDGPHRAGHDAARLADAWLAATAWEALAA